MNIEDKRIIIRARDLAAQCTRKGIPFWSDFLNEREAAQVRLVLKAFPDCDYCLWGGHEDAQRVVLCVYPPPYEPPHGDFPIDCLSVAFRKEDTLTHRDFLGALMSLGIERDVVGDILVQEGKASFFVKSEIAPYITSQLTAVGRVGVRFCDTPVDFSDFKQTYVEKICTVASTRMDNIIAAAYNMSRGKAQSVIISGLVMKNYEAVYSADRRVSDGDVISVRGFGKLIVSFDGTTSKKGKYKITIKQFC